VILVILRLFFDLEVYRPSLLSAFLEGTILTSPP
jgi:hypothetical protein